MDAEAAGEPSAQGFWNQVLQEIDGDADRVLAQVEGAREQYPELASAFSLLLSYVHFLHGTIVGLTPFPPTPLPVPFGFPAEICRRDRLICDCAHGDVGACKALGVYGERPAEIVPMPTCEELWERYRAAVKRAKDALAAAAAGRPYYFEEGELRKTDPAVRSAWLELLAQRCVEFPVELGGVPSNQ